MLCACKEWATGYMIRVRLHQMYNSPSTFTLCRRRRGGHGTSYNSSWAQCDGTGSNEWGVHCWLRMRRFKEEGYELYCPQRFRMRIFTTPTPYHLPAMTSHVIRSPILSQKNVSDRTKVFDYCLKPINLGMKSRVVLVELRNL